MVRSGLLLVAFLLTSCSGGSVTDDGEDAGGAADADGYSGDDGGPGEPDAGGDDAGQQDDGPLADPDECARMQTAWVFCSGFEEGNKDIWDDYDDNPDETNLLMEDPGPLDLAGNHVMRLRVPAGRGGADCGRRSTRIRGATGGRQARSRPPHSQHGGDARHVFGGDGQGLDIRRRGTGTQGDGARAPGA